MGTADAQRLIALSLGKIAMSRQQRGGINLHKNLLVASVLHKARTTYMMDNFQTLLANKRAQAEKEAAAKMIIETSVDTNTSSSRQCESMIEPEQARGVTDCTTNNNIEVSSGERPVNGNRLINNNTTEDKENAVPVSQIVENKKSCVRDTRDSSPIVTGKVPLGVSEHNKGSSDYVSQLPSCRCAGNNKRRRSFVDTDSVTQPKKPRYEDDSENSDSENECETKDYLETRGHEIMHTEQSHAQVTNLVDIFNSGFNGLYKDNESNSENNGSGHINVYVSADRSISGHQYVLTDLSCATQVKESVSIPTAIALAV